MLRLREQRVQVERGTEHGDGAVAGARPLLLRPVAVELDPVPVRVGEIDRLTDAVVRGAAEGMAGREEAAESVGERGRVGVANRDVEEAGVPGGRRRAAAALPRVQADV